MYDETSYESYESEQYPRRNPLATASVVLGIISLLSALMIYISLPCGALAVILAVLSRIDQSMLKKAKTGLICGFCGMIGTVIVTFSAFYFVLSDSSMRSLLEYYCQIYIGDYSFDLEEELHSIFPFLEYIGIPETETPSIPEPKGDGALL